MNKVRIEEGTLLVDLPTGVKRLPVQPLPARYIDWIERGRRRLYARIRAGGTRIQFFSGHLPVLVTRGADPTFPFNCGNKGVGFLPRTARLAEFIELFRKTLHDTRHQPWNVSLPERVKAVSRFYFAREAIEFRALTALEIFEKNTLQNLRRTPLASLLFTGGCPDYVSFQLNCAVEVIGPEDPRHTFVALVRALFEHEGFHLTQSRFPHAYVFWISEVLDKTPYRVDGRAERPPGGPGSPGVRWHEEALRALDRAPGMIRTMIRETVEHHARERGAPEITLALLREARANARPIREREPG